MAANKINMKLSESKRPMDNLEQPNLHLLHLANQLKKSCWFLARVARYFHINIKVMIWLIEGANDNLDLGKPCYTQRAAFPIVF